MAGRGARALLVAAALLLVAAPLRAQERGAIVVTPGATKSFRAALQTFAGDGPRAQLLRDEIGAGLEYSGAFQLLGTDAFLGPVVSPSAEEPPTCSDWTPVGADALVAGEVRSDVAEVVVSFSVWDTAQCRSLLRKRYRQALDGDLGRIGRRIADDVVEAFLGIRGVASTEIAFVSTRAGASEIYVMGADGSSPRPATANRSINAFPSWSPDGEVIVYTSYRYRDRPFLFVSSRGRRRPGRLLPQLNGAALQFRGVFDPSGKRLAVVLGRGSGSDIYSVRADGSRLSRLTRSGAIDVSPSWSPDGKRLAFGSDRAGTPQIYLMDAGGGKAQRLTFQGNYNTRPAWSPDGRWIAYESRVGSQFDIWLIDVEGATSFPIVTNPRSDEAPAWAPNSRKLAFSSTRRGRSDIYIADVDGDNVRRLTRDAGENTSPAWGPFPR